MWTHLSKVVKEAEGLLFYLFRAVRRSCRVFRPRPDAVRWGPVRVEDKAISARHSRCESGSQLRLPVQAGAQA